MYYFVSILNNYIHTGTGNAYIFATVNYNKYHLILNI